MNNTTLKNYVVAVIQPFVLVQHVYVYENGECSKNIYCTLADLNETCYNLCKDYNIKTLDLIGARDYIARIKDEISTMTKYKNFQIDINLNQGVKG